MCALAARLFDPTVHGGMVMMGFPTVIIEGKPASRVGDPHICPMMTPTPHVGGPILPPGAMTVLIGGQPAARMGDWGLCILAPVDPIIFGALRTNIGPAAVVPPPIPGLWSMGQGAGGEPYLVNFQWVTNWVAGVNAAVGWNAGAVVAVAAGALGAVAVALVVWVAVVKVRDARTHRIPGSDDDRHESDHGCCGCHHNATLIDEGVTDDAPVYFL
jgi:uncharacterized Zn-binding protein involved in type VI secretion